jgi:hypothetical protein
MSSPKLSSPAHRRSRTIRFEKEKQKSAHTHTNTRDRQRKNRTHRSVKKFFSPLSSAAASGSQTNRQEGGWVRGGAGIDGAQNFRAGC